MYSKEPIYVDDIISITQCSGKISCVRFDKEIITIRFYDRDEKHIIINREEKEFINCSISDCGNNRTNVYISVNSDEIIRGYKTSLTSAKLIKEYYESYNEYLKMFFLEEEKKKIVESIKVQKDEVILQNLNLYNIDKMTGFEFEEFIGTLFRKIGYKVVVTKKSNDQGIDIIVQDDFIKIGIQAKCYNGVVGNKAIQEAVAGKSYYKCDKALVITNSSFTQSAIELAKCNYVGLISRQELSEMINKYS